jgi:hypothetical protein
VFAAPPQSRNRPIEGRSKEGLGRLHAGSLLSQLQVEHEGMVPFTSGPFVSVSPDNVRFQIQIASVTAAGVEIGEPFDVSTYWGYEGFKHTEYHGIKK